MCLGSMAPRGGTSASLCACVWMCGIEKERDRTLHCPHRPSPCSQTMDSVLDDCSRPAIHTQPQAMHETAAPHAPGGGGVGARHTMRTSRERYIKEAREVGRDPPIKLEKVQEEQSKS